MSKQIQKIQAKGGHLPLIIALVALVLSVVALCAIWQIDQNTRLWSESSLKNDINYSDRQSRFEFCFNNNIRPCDDISLKAFNDQPENKTSGNTFPIKSVE